MDPSYVGLRDNFIQALAILFQESLTHKNKSKNMAYDNLDSKGRITDIRNRTQVDLLILLSNIA